MSIIFINTHHFLSAVLVRCDHSAAYPFTPNPHTGIFLLQEGRGEIYNGDLLLTILEGDILVIHPHTEYWLRSTTDTCLRGIIISVCKLHISGLPQGLLLEPDMLPLIRIEEEFNHIKRLFSDIYKEATTSAFGSAEIIVSLLQTLLILLYRFTNQNQCASTTSIPQTVRAYIERNYPEDLSLTDLAGVVYVSPYYLAHLFKVEIGISPIQYLIKCRIDKAKKLLSGTKLSVQDISMQVGYSNSNYFNLLFKKMTGVSPGKFRKQ
ncbi:helix-turn-helix domain-containing protein [Paenibacillus sp. GCM10027629]|uniref:AraC family transcriptional regulator n=1 Tax=Paenibacillus sp. GCM10027629 TaxID=3273414 RepID=UPI0036326112